MCQVGWQNMGIASFSRLDRLMAEQLGDNRDWNAFEEHLRSEIMAQGVRPERRDRGTSGDFCELHRQGMTRADFDRAEYRPRRAVQRDRSLPAALADYCNSARLRAEPVGGKAGKFSCAQSGISQENNTVPSERPGDGQNCLIFRIG